MLSKIHLQAENQNVYIILRIIEKHKHILFGQHNLKASARATKWQEIYDQAIKLEIAPPHKTWKYIRDVLWKRWKNKTLEKTTIIDQNEHNKVNITNSLDKCDHLILDILGLKVEPIEIPTIKVELNSEPEEEFEIISDEDITLQSETISGNFFKSPNITFIPVKKHTENNSDTAEWNNVNKKRKLSTIENITNHAEENTPSTSKQNNQQNIIEPKIESELVVNELTETSIKFPAEIKNIHKMILENVRDIKMKLFIPKKPTNCESCCNSNKEILLVQNKILEIQQQNLQIQMQILDELKKINVKQEIVTVNDILKDSGSSSSSNNVDELGLKKRTRRKQK